MIPTLVHQPPGSVARSARARPSWEAEQSTVIGKSGLRQLVGLGGLDRHGPELRGLS